MNLVRKEDLHMPVVNLLISPRMLDQRADLADWSVMLQREVAARVGARCGSREAVCRPETTHACMSGDAKNDGCTSR